MFRRRGPQRRQPAENEVPSVSDPHEVSALAPRLAAAFVLTLGLGGALAPAIARSSTLARLRSHSPKRSSAGQQDTATRATIAFLESDRPDAPRAGDGYGDQAQVGAGALLAHDEHARTVVAADVGGVRAVSDVLDRPRREKRPGSARAPPPREMGRRAVWAYAARRFEPGTACGGGSAMTAAASWGQHPQGGVRSNGSRPWPHS
jgi:hypothetical protein